MKIVVKIGTGSVLADDGSGLHPAMDNIAHEIAQFKKEGHEIILVSSGAVGMGRQMLETGNGRKIWERTLERKQFLASVGQPLLIAAWGNLLAGRGLHASQLLLTRDEVLSPDIAEKIRGVLQEANEQGNIVPIINENDAIATEELEDAPVHMIQKEIDGYIQAEKGFDNDKLASLLAQAWGADILVLLTGADGIFDRDPAKPKAVLHNFLDARKPPPLITGKSKEGRGGIASKLSSAFSSARAGIITVIGNAREFGILRRAVSAATAEIPPPGLTVVRMGGKKI